MSLLSFLCPLPWAPEKRCVHNRSCRRQYPSVAPLYVAELVTHLLIMPHSHLSLPEARGPLVIHPGPPPHNISIFLQICHNSPPPAFSNLSSTLFESHSLSPANVSVSQSHLLPSYSEGNWLSPDAITSPAIFPLVPTALVWPAFTLLTTHAFYTLLSFFLPRTQMLWHLCHQTLLPLWYVHFPDLQ